MKITHRRAGANWWQPPVSDPVDPAFQAEVQAHTGRSEHEYRLREARLRKAEARLRKARALAKPKPKQVASLVVLVELRRAELEEYRQMMTAYPASATHRGRRGYRPVPPTQGTPL